MYIKRGIGMFRYIIYICHKNTCKKKINEAENPPAKGDIINSTSFTKRIVKMTLICLKTLGEGERNSINMNIQNNIKYILAEVLGKINLSKK